MIKLWKANSFGEVCSNSEMAKNKYLGLGKLGNIEKYYFSPPLNIDKFAFFKFTINPCDPPLISDYADEELANEFILAETEKEYSKVLDDPMDSEDINENKISSIRKSLNRIIRYTNDRFDEERVGFASNLAVYAEEIGIPNTIEYLLPAICRYTVILVQYRLKMKPK